MRYTIECVKKVLAKWSSLYLESIIRMSSAVRVNSKSEEVTNMKYIIVGNCVGVEKQRYYIMTARSNLTVL